MRTFKGQVDKAFAMVTVLVLSLPGSSFAGTMLDFYNSGTTDFSYTGSLTGGFSANGGVESLSEFPVDTAGATVGYLRVDDEPGAEGASFVAYGGVVNPDETMDVVFVWIVREGEPGIPAGTYEVDAEQTVLIGFYDDADAIIVFEGSPPFISSAAHVFIAEIGGSVTIDAIDGSVATGSFSCTMVDQSDPNTTISVTDAAFTVNREEVPVESVSWGRVKSIF